MWNLLQNTCPLCHRFVLTLVNNSVVQLGDENYSGAERLRYLVRPKAACRPAPPKEVPEEFSADFREASLVLMDSPKASAALSRRCLQHLLREKAGVKKADLAKEIDEVISSGGLPAHLMEAVDGVRNIGNFAAHPVKAKDTGLVLPVEPGEAEWTLDVLEGLFDFYFVQPARLAARRMALNKKLESAGKPPLK
ncbi:MAG: DUF4145 domain-containing protein [Denitromonas halophila]|nr:MAG: DUF4145 domain-containing protein [Denitromonas halophila]